MLRFETVQNPNSFQDTISNVSYVPVKLSIDDQGGASIEINEVEGFDKEVIDLFKKKYSKNDLLPKRVVIYYSGISDHMTNVYKIIEKNVLKKLTKDPEQSRDGYVLPVSIPIVLFQAEDYELLLASLLSFGYNSRIDEILYRKLELQHPVGLFLTIIVDKKEFDKKYVRSRLANIDRDMLLIEDNGGEDLVSIKKQMLSDLLNDRIENFFGAGGRLGTFLHQLKESSNNKSDSYSHSENKYIFKFTIGQWQALAEEIIQAPKKLFELLFMLKHNNLLTDIQIKIIKNDTEIDSNYLSEGEKQIIIISALNEVISTENSLALLDEPDNFLHPHWQKKLVPYITEVSEEGNYHIVVSTHSPFAALSVPIESIVIFGKSGKELEYPKLPISSYPAVTSELFHITSEYNLILEETKYF